MARRDPTRVDRVADQPGAVDRRHRAGGRPSRTSGTRGVAVDNTFATPFLQQPLALGADVSLHSSTKYLGGHSDVVGGFAAISDAELADEVRYLQNAMGAVPSPFDCYLVLRGVKTLAIEWSATASTRARSCSCSWSTMRSHECSTGADHPGHDVARRQMRDFGGMVSFLAANGEDAALDIVARTRLFTLAESLSGRVADRAPGADDPRVGGRFAARGRSRPGPALGGHRGRRRPRRRPPAGPRRGHGPLTATLENRCRTVAGDLFGELEWDRAAPERGRARIRSHLADLPVAGIRAKTSRAASMPTPVRRYLRRTKNSAMSCGMPVRTRRKPAAPGDPEQERPGVPARSMKVEIGYRRDRARRRRRRMPPKSCTGTARSPSQLGLSSRWRREPRCRPPLESPVTYVLIHGGGSTARFWDRHFAVPRRARARESTCPGRNGKQADLRRSPSTRRWRRCSRTSDPPGAGTGRGRRAFIRWSRRPSESSCGLGARVEHVVLSAALVPTEGGCGVDCMKPRHREGLARARRGRTGPPRPSTPMITLLRPPRPTPGRSAPRTAATRSTTTRSRTSSIPSAAWPTRCTTISSRSTGRPPRTFRSRTC